MPEINEIIGGYKLRTLIHQAQYTKVYEVVEPRSNRHFAMKLIDIPSDHKEFEPQKQMLLNEAEIGKKMKHDNVVNISAVGKTSKVPYFVMEYFPAGSIRVRLMSKEPKEKQFLVDKGKDIFRQVATGLAYMNASGYVHCDIKPDNILVNSLGQAKIIDFAISKPVKKGFFAKLFHRAGKPQGTPSYMPPEQINDELLDGRADIYCYGAMLYEIVCGRPPFRGANTNELLKKHLVEKPPPPQSWNPELTDDFSNYVLKLLAKKKDERPRNFHEILMALKDLRVYKVTGGKGKAPAAG